VLFRSSIIDKAQLKKQGINTIQDYIAYRERGGAPLGGGAIGGAASGQIVRQFSDIQ
jgi:hypothetical protein